MLLQDLAGWGKYGNSGAGPTFRPAAGSDNVSVLVGPHAVDAAMAAKAVEYSRLAKVAVALDIICAKLPLTDRCSR